MCFHSVITGRQSVGYRRTWRLMHIASRKRDITKHSVSYLLYLYSASNSAKLVGDNNTSRDTLAYDEKVTGDVFSHHFIMKVRELNVGAHIIPLDGKRPRESQHKDVTYSTRAKCGRMGISCLTGEGLL